MVQDNLGVWQGQDVWANGLVGQQLSGLVSVPNCCTRNVFTATCYAYFLHACTACLARESKWLREM